MHDPADPTSAEALDDGQALPDIEVRASGVHGQGVFARRSLRKGQAVGVYGGRRYSLQEACARDWDNTRTYVYALSDGTYIDGREGGDFTRLINHSCDPNCRAVELCQPGGRCEIRIETRRRLRAGEELTLDYRLDIGDDDPAAYRCRCGSPRCRGTMAQRPAKP